MPGDDFRFTTELPHVDVSKLDRVEAREVEGLYRAKEHLTATLRDRLIDVEGERDLLQKKVDRLQADRDALRDRLDALETDRGSVAPDRLVASLGDAFASARDDLSTADYAVGRIEVDLKANVVGGEDGPRFQLPDLAESVNRETLSTLRFDLRPAKRPETEGMNTYDPIPDVRDRSLDEARDAIRRAGFTVGEVTTEPGDTDGVVREQFPSPRSVAEPGSPVDLTVSERRDPEVPSVVGLDVDDAMTALSDTDLGVGDVDVEARSAPADTVIGQSPPAGETVSVGTRVDLTVSAGPATTDADDRTPEAGPKPTGDGTPDDDDADTIALRTVDGIGPTYADRLRAADITDVSTLLDRDPAEVAEIANVSTTHAEGWFEHAKGLVDR